MCNLKKIHVIFINAKGNFEESIQYGVDHQEIVKNICDMHSIPITNIRKIQCITEIK
jgi:hypothetical protein